jgi:DNA uptake protein ComE-like DNA-binding protein
MKSAPFIPASLDIELDSDSDTDLRKGVNNLSTNSPARRVSPPKSTSNLSMTSASRTNSSLSASQSSVSASQTTLPFKKLVGAFRYSGQDANPTSSSSPSDLLSDQSLSSPGQSESENDHDHDVIMTGARNSNINGSNGHSHSTKLFKRQIISSDEDDALEVKPRRRLVKKGDLDRASTATPDIQVPQRRRLVKRALLDSDSDSDVAKPSKPIEILSDDDVDVASSLDESLAKLQNKYLQADFDDLKSALDKADGEYALADGILASKFNNLFDLGGSTDRHSTQRSPHPGHSLQQNRLDRLVHKSSSFKVVHMPVKSAPAPARKKSRSSQSDDMSDDSGDSYDEGERNTYQALDRKEERALTFFNEATLLELRELSGCSKAQASGVIGLRPFNNFDHLCVTLRKTKGVGEKIVNSYLTTTDAIRAVDTMLKTVDRVREDLVRTLSVWCGDENGKLFESGSNSNSMKVDKADKAAEVQEEDDEPGMELLSVDVDKASATEEGKEAMRHFIRKQPGNMAPGFQLKGYQLLGINWLALLWRKKLSGILADEVNFSNVVLMMVIG